MMDDSEFITLTTANDNPGGATAVTFPLTGMITVIARAYVTAHAGEQVATENPQAANPANSSQISRISSTQLVDMTDSDICDAQPGSRQASPADAHAQSRMM